MAVGGPSGRRGGSRLICFASARFGPQGAEFGALILNVVTATMLVVQVVGPVLVKFAITQAGEVGQAVGVEVADVPAGSAEPGR